ncbi:hypothetical protein [Algoriphagus formosus]|uniref:hypothetical protein n=1 Tax=Algoriphagus formosus TaxID=2007308 RepID=UPI003F711E4C
MKKLNFIILGLISLIFSCQAPQRLSDEISIPYAKEEWKGVQGKTLADSKPDFIGQPEAPEGAPNVLVIMLDVIAN